jgi:hypothetical protein
MQLAMKTSKEKLSQIKSLEKRIDEYVNINTNYRTIKEVPLAYLADRIALQKPNELWFSKVLLYPFPSKLETNKPILINNSVIKVIGTIKTPEILNEFLRNLKKEAWIKDIQLQNYKWKSDKTIAEFEINILKN